MNQTPSTHTTITTTFALLQLGAVEAGSDGWTVAEEHIRRAAAHGAELLVLPELFRTPYFCRTIDTSHFDLAEPLGGDTCQRLAALAAELDVVIVGSFFERVMPGVHFNTAIVCDRDMGMIGYYRKAHIPEDPSYYEKFYFAPGDTGYQVFDTSVGRIAVLICWDQWYPEAARSVALRGAEMIVYPTAIGTLPEEDDAERGRQMEAWAAVQRGHAIANGLYVAAVNRAGTEGELSFWGHSFAYGPQGEAVAQADADVTQVFGTLDRDRIAEVRHMWPFFRDRRIDLTEDLQRRAWSSHTTGPEETR